jgi:hypothetical protein
LQTGYCKLPKFHVKINNFEHKIEQTDAKISLNESLESKNLDLVVQSMLPTQIFIMPQSTNIASSA